MTPKKSDLDCYWRKIGTIFRPNWRSRRFHGVFRHKDGPQLPSDPESWHVWNERRQRWTQLNVRPWMGWDGMTWMIDPAKLDGYDAWILVKVWYLWHARNVLNFRATHEVDSLIQFNHLRRPVLRWVLLRWIYVSRFQLAACYPAINELLSLLSWFMLLIWLDTISETQLLAVNAWKRISKHKFVLLESTFLVSTTLSRRGWVRF